MEVRMRICLLLEYTTYRALPNSTFSRKPTLYRQMTFTIFTSFEKVTVRIQKRWVSTVDSIHEGIRGATVANHFTKLIIRLSFETNEQREVRLVYDGSIDSKLKEISDNTKTDWFGALKHIDNLEFYNIAFKMAIATKDYSIRTSFRYFQPWMFSDLMLLHMVFPNSTMGYDANTTSAIRRAGDIQFEDTANPYTAFEETGFKFITCRLGLITCGGVVRGTVSLIGYVSAFDNWIWAWFAIFVIAASTAVVLSSGFLTVELTMFERISTLDCIFMPLDTALEQGSVGVVLSKAYKGQNVMDLSSPIPLIKPTKFTDLVEMNFTIYTYPVDEQTIEFEKPNILSNLILEADSGNGIVQKYMRIHEKLANFTNNELFNSIRNTSYVRYVEKIKSCDRTAFMGWSDEIESSRLHLYDILSNAGRHSDKEFISLGEETLFQMTKGWTLRNVAIVTKDILTRMSAMLESGIGPQWKKIEKLVKNLQLILKTQGRLRSLPALALNDNISVVFYVHCGLLIATCITCIIELWFGYLVLSFIVKTLLKYTGIQFGG
ncbi:unnamed protein product [Orchesella dallaii]|uniref:Uncharacterized protein n=1 Tax=Orchesella dallaii TaxID=48710 RepID=A0ABP1RS44_9HEXA